MTRGAGVFDAGDSFCGGEARTSGSDQMSGIPATRNSSTGRDTVRDGAARGGRKDVFDCYVRARGFPTAYRRAARARAGPGRWSVPV